MGEEGIRKKRKRKHLKNWNCLTNSKGKKRFFARPLAVITNQVAVLTFRGNYEIFTAFSKQHCFAHAGAEGKSKKINEKI